MPKFNSQKSKSPKWYTTEMRHTINRCKTLTRRNKSKPTESTSLRLSNLSTHLQELMTTAKSEYEKSLAVCFKFNPSKLFRHLRDLSKKSPQTRTIIHNGSIITETGQIAEIFNKYFNSTFTRSDYTLPPWDKMPSPTYQLSSISIEESEVYETLTSLDTTKSPGHDNINASTLKCCATALTRSVTHIFNSSLSSHTFPPHWKVHKICPIPKKGDPHLVENFRPISLLPIISKVFETIIYKKIITFVRPKITCQQFGFLRNRSCLSQLILFFSQVFDNIENRKPTDVIYLDFKKAFDTVPHNELLLKLWKTGITGPLWLWFKSYLHDRIHFTSVINTPSNYLPVMSGVPQGSILGPLLFIIFINDLPECISSANPFLFADDTKLVKCITSTEDQLELQTDINQLSSWCTTWNMQLNEGKCNVLRITHPSWHEENPNTLYSIHNSHLNFATKEKDLGLCIANNLSWSLHYNLISSKAYRALNLIRRTISMKSETSTKKSLYITLVRSQVTYCSQVWRPNLIKDIQKLERIQRRATKFILNDYSSSYRSRLSDLKLLPLMYWFEIQDIMFLVKSLKEPSDNFNIRDHIKFVTGRTRFSCNNKLTVQANHYSASRHFYLNRITRLWNLMPTMLMDISAPLTSTKNTLHHYFWEHFKQNFVSDIPCTYHLMCPCNRCYTRNYS